MIVPAIAAAIAMIGPMTAAPAIRSRIDALVQAAMLHQHLPGLSLAVAHNGRILYARGYGLRDIAAHEPADAHTIYNIASNTKQFTAAAIMLLQQDGKLSVDDRLSRYIPSYPQAGRITLRELLNHTSGIPDYTDLSDVPHHATAMQFFDLVAKLPLHFTPGTRYEYSNTNFMVLGIIVEQVSKMSYGEFLAHRIFQPIGMTETSTRVVPQSRPNGAVGYSYVHPNVKPIPQTIDDLGYGDGTINSSVIDLVKWDTALDAGRVVDASSFREMTTPPRAQGEGASDGAYGFGLSIGSFMGQRQVQHYGLNPGYGSINSTYPDDGFDIVMISNGDAFDETWLERQIFALFFPSRAGDRTGYDPTAPGEDSGLTTRAMAALRRLQTGAIGGGASRQMSADAGAAGSPRRIVFEGMDYRSGGSTYVYTLYFASAVVEYDFSIDPRGKITSLVLARED
jgi:D-alanyl-D-alanine carboxypeptidase